MQIYTNDAADYDFEFNGVRTGIKVSIKQALQSDIWDVVTLQQASSALALIITHISRI